MQVVNDMLSLQEVERRELEKKLNGLRGVQMYCGNYVRSFWPA